MPGSIRSVGKGTWEIRIYLGRDDQGRVRHLHRRVRGLKRDAQRALVELQIEATRRSSSEELSAAHDWGPRTTIDDAITAWRETGWADLSPSTTRRYESIWTTHIRGGIGARRIGDLGPYDLERYFRGLKSKGLSEASVRQTRALLHRACRLARKWSGNVLDNPVADTDLPEWQLAEQSEPVRSPELDEVRHLLDAARKLDRRFAVYLRVVAATGARRGEICALRWNDIDEERGAVRLDESVVSAVGHAAIKAPKTRAGVRTIAIDHSTVRALQDLRVEIDEQADASGVERTDSCFVFASEISDRRPPHPDTMSHLFARVRTLAGMSEDLHLHSLRHFQSTALDPVLPEAQKQARLGWSTVHMARHYTDAIPEEDRRAADHIGNLLDSSADEDASPSAGE